MKGRRKEGKKDRMKGRKDGVMRRKKDGGKGWKEGRKWVLSIAPPTF